jgi:hypothetical protein
MVHKSERRGMCPPQGTPQYTQCLLQELLLIISTNKGIAINGQTWVAHMLHSLLHSFLHSILGAMGL